MLSVNKVRSVAIGALLLSGGFVASAEADVFDFSFSGPSSGPGNPVFGSGTITTAGAGPSFSVIGVTGTVTDLDITSNPFFITGPISSYAGADNILFFPAATTGSNTTPGFVDFGGISFQTSGGPGFDFNLGGYSQTGPMIYVLNAEFLNGPGYPAVAGSTIINLDITETPLPAALPLFMGGLGLVGLVSRRRKRKEGALATA
jgi:hypothetical protein